MIGMSTRPETYSSLRAGHRTPTRESPCFSGGRMSKDLLCVSVEVQGLRSASSYVGNAGKASADRRTVRGHAVCPGKPKEGQSGRDRVVIVSGGGATLVAAAASMPHPV